MRDEIRGPSARRTDMVIGEAPDGVLIYDRATHHIHQLNQLAADVWNACDGQAGIVEVARQVSHRRGEAIGIETVQFAVAELERAGLLEGASNAAISQGRQSRRTFLRRAAATGAAIPMVMSTSAPAAAQQTSCEGEPIDFSNCGVSGNEGKCCWDPWDCAGVCRSGECIAFSSLCGTS